MPAFLTSFWTSVQTALQGSLTDWLIYGCIAAVTLIGLFKCLIPLWTTTRALRRAIASLQEHAGEHNPGERPVWQETRFMGKRLKGCWLRFLQNAEQLDRRGLPCAVEDYINDDTVTHGPGNAQLAELIPNLLTSLGILGTFIGMTRGLAGLNTSATEEMMAGIQTLITGMRFAFGTSVAGVSCALAFNMLNRIAQGSSYRAIDDFVESFTTLAMQRPLDNDVQLICQNQDRNRLLGEVTENVSGRMAASIELAVGRAMHPVAASMDKFLMAATQSQLAGMQQMTDLFLSRLNAAMNNEFLELGRTLAGVNQQQQISQERLNQTIGAAQSITSDVIRLGTVSTDMMKHFERYVGELTVARQRDEGFEQSASNLLGSMQTAAGDQASLIASLQKEQEKLARAVGDYADTGAQKEALAKACEAFAGKVGEISRLMDGFSAEMQAMNRLLERQTAAAEGETAALSQLQKTLTAMGQTMADGKAREEG